MTESSLDFGAPLVEAVRAIEASRRRIAVVVSGDGRLVGTLTDGDIRRCLLAGGNLETPVSLAMNPKPMVAPSGSTDGYLIDIMRRGNILAVPLMVYLVGIPNPHMAIGTSALAVAANVNVLS